MGAFWSLFLLGAYGILGGFVQFANGWLGRFGVATDPWSRQVPILGEFGPGALVAVIVQAVYGFVLYKILSRPKAVDYLIETEAEMKKVVWPSWKDTSSGSLAVIITVAVMLVFLLAVDTFLLGAFNRLFNLSLGG